MINVHLTDPEFERLLQNAALAASLAPDSVYKLQLVYEAKQAVPLKMQVLK